MAAISMVVHLHLGGLEVPDPERDLPLRVEGVRPPQPLLLRRAGVLAEKLQDLGLVRVHDEQPRPHNHHQDEGHHPADDGHDALGLLTFGRKGADEPVGDPERHEKQDQHHEQTVDEPLLDFANHVHLLE
jgi:hypothetical protein